MSLVIKKLSWGHLLVFAGIIALAGIVCGTVRAAERNVEKGKKGLNVTLLLYSGRPNPTFVLEDKQSIDRVKQLISNSKAVTEPAEGAATHPILGYNGIVVENPDGIVAGLPSSMHVQKGNVTEVRDGKKKLLQDQTNELETFLLNKAVEKKVIDKKIVEKIKTNE